MNITSWQAYRKTFLAGEYAACQFGRGLLLNYGPAFQMTVGHHWQLSDLAKQILNRYDIKHSAPLVWLDPEPPHGGVGASSAELACLYNYLCINGFEKETTLVNKRAWYQTHTWSGKGLKPSGLDFLSQQLSGLIWIDCQNNICKPLDWPFDDLIWLVIKTNEKLKTYTHLESIVTKPEFGFLNDYLDSVKTALENASLTDFISALSHYDAGLNSLNFYSMAKADMDALEHVQSKPNIYYARGCGAMGKDTWLVLTKRATLAQSLAHIKHVYPFNKHYVIDLKEAA